MNIYIGNLPRDLEEDELVEMFAEYGDVKCAKIIRDRHTKLSRGYGFIEMSDHDSALKAIDDWDQGSIDDHIIKVKIAYSSQRSNSTLKHANA